MRLSGYAAGAAAFACVLGAWPAAVSRDSELPRLPNPVVQSASKSDFLSAERREELRILDANGGVYDDAQLCALVGQIVERLAAWSDRPGLRYRVVILNAPAVNAFSLPSGRLYVTRGLLALANDASELAAVLSHEIGHVTARHAPVRDADAGQSPAGQAADAFGDPQFRARAFAGSNFPVVGFSHSQELEADTIGARVSAQAGYDPYGAVRFLNAMSRGAQLRSLGAVDVPSSHPATADRAAAALANARQYGAPGLAERDAAVMLANIDGLLYGDDPNNGLVRGRQFLHPRLGFAFTAPQGFALARSAQAVVGLRAGGGEMLRLDTITLPPEQDLADYLGSGWMEGLDQGSIAETRINGFDAATASAEGSQWSFRIAVVRLDKGVVRLIYAAKPGTRDAERAFGELAGAVRAISASEIEAATPLRLRVVAVMPGETPEKLARRMAAVDRPLERFLVLNGLSAGQALKPGDRVKIITQDGHIRR
ncbi:MAG TPA: M48 family metalloprotease [Xanthobacteraceae bacterium]|nr:M48 family metalloprotease [Xanthobacteraceae bacterium]